MMVAFSLRMKESQALKIKYIADKQERSQNKQIEFILNQYIADYEKVNGEIKIKE